MPLETATYISELDPTWPLGTDNVSQGDDHLRLIKDVLQNTLLNADGPVDLSNIGTVTGTIIIFAGPVQPEGYLFCDGTAISRTTYADLYTAIGDAWGAGDGSTTFNLPDMRARVPGGAGFGNVLGDDVGSDTWTADDLPSHTHTAAHSHQIGQNPNGDLVADGTYLRPHGTTDDAPLTYVTSETTALTTDPTGTGGDNRQATNYVNYVIKT